MGRYIGKLRTLPFMSVMLVAANVVIYLLCQLPGNTLYGRGCLSAFEIVSRQTDHQYHSKRCDIFHPPGRKKHKRQQ